MAYVSAQPYGSSAALTCGPPLSPPREVVNGMWPQPYGGSVTVNRAPQVKTLTLAQAMGKDTTSYRQRAQAALEEYKEKAKAKASEFTSLLKDPQFQTLTISTATGTVVVGAIGGAFGMASGMVAGSIVGIPPALFTFGLSIPAGAVVGAGAGSGLGLAGGTGVGALTGYGTYKYRLEIKDGLVFVKVKAVDTVERRKAHLLEAVDTAKLQISGAVDKTKAKAGELTTYVRARTIEAHDIAKSQVGEAVHIATTTKVGVTCTSAAAGAVVGSTGGGVMGTISGVALGVVPAIFTFGLSIPVGAACGLCIGASVGGASGATGGAAVGYGGFTYRNEIGSGAQQAWDKACTSAQSVKAKAVESATHVTESVRTLVGGGTGGTA